MIKPITAIILSAILTPLPVMSDSPVKPYMDYRTITDTASPQYAITRQAVHEADGRLTVDGYTCVALGQQYGEVGDRFILTVGGEEYKVIMADAKRYCDTAGGAGWTGTNGHVVEMVVDSGMLPSECRALGDCDSLMPGSIQEVKRLEL